MVEYYDLLKRPGGAKSVNQHDGFGDLLSECRVSAKEGVEESKVAEAVIKCPECGDELEVLTAGDERERTTYWCERCDKEIPRSEVEEKQLKEYFDPTHLIADLDASYSREAFEEQDFDEYPIGDLVGEVREVLPAVEAYAKEHNITRCSELPGEFPTFWLETSDAFDMAFTGDWSPLEGVLQAVIDYGHPEEHEGESDETSESRKVDETEAGEARYEEVLQDMIKSIRDDPHYDVDKLIDDVTKSWDIPRSQAIEIYNKANSEEYLDTGDVYLEESKVNELDEPDLERPEKARRRKPKRKKPGIDEPDLDKELDRKPEEEPIEEPEKEPGVPEIGEEPDADEVPPPPEEIKEPEAPIEMRKEYLGRSEDVHYYFITLEGEGGVVDDFVIADQEGVKKYSAKDQNIEVTEENIADFIIEAIRDMDIAQIERSIFMKYVYPKLIERAPEEEMVEEPEEEERPEGESTPLGPEEEEELPRESKKITDSTSEDSKSKPPKKYSEEEQLKRRKEDHAVITGDKKVKENSLIEMKVTDGVGNEFDVNLAPDDTDDAVININGREFRFSGEFASMWRDEEGNISEEGLEELALDALAMMEEEEYQELLTNGRDEYKEPIDAKGLIDVDEEPEVEPEHEIETGGDAGEEVEDDGKDDWPPSAPPPEETTDDVDVSKGDIHRKPKYRPKEEQVEEVPEAKGMLPTDTEHIQDGYWYDEEGNPVKVHDSTSDMLVIKHKPGKTEKILLKDFLDKYSRTSSKSEGKNQPGVRDGTGPAKDSAQRSVSDVGRRKQAGEKCPKEDKENEDIEGGIVDEKKKTAELSDKELHLLKKLVGNAWPVIRAEIDAEIEKRKKDKKENENVEGDNDMIEEKTVLSLLAAAKKLEVRAKEIRKEAEGLEKKEKEAKAKKEEGVDPKKEDSEEKKIKKLAEEEVKEEKIDETDVAKGAKALVTLAKDALKAGNYTEAAEHCAKLAEIEAVIPPEADAEAKKDDKAKPTKKDDKEDKKPEKKEDDISVEDVPEKPGKDDADEKKKPPICDKCGKAHWPFEKCADVKEEVDEAKAEKAKAKKEKEAKAKKDKKDKEEKARKAKAKKAKESKIPVERTEEDITERKSIESLKNLLGM